MSTAAAGKHALVPNLSKKFFSVGRYRLNYRTSFPFYCFATLHYDAIVKLSLFSEFAIIF